MQVLIALLVYYQAQKERINFSKSALGVFLENTFKAENAVEQEKLVAIQRILKQLIKYNEIVQHFEVALKAKVVSQHTKSVFEFLTKILHSFKSDGWFNIVQISLFYARVDQKS